MFVFVHIADVAQVIIVNAVVVTWLTDWSLSNGGKSRSACEEEFFVCSTHLN